MLELEVGKPYLLNCNRFEEGIELNFEGDRFQINYFCSSPSKIEIQAVKRGNSSFYLFIYKKIIFVIFRFEPLLWFDTPFCWWSMPPEVRSLPNCAISNAAVFKVVLINADTGFVLAIRDLILNPDFSKKLAKAIAEQIKVPIDYLEYEAIVEEAYSLYCDPKAMLAQIIE